MASLPLPASSHSSSTPTTHSPKPMDVALLGETIDAILNELPTLKTNTASGPGLSPNDTQQLGDCLRKIQDAVDSEKKKQNLVQGGDQKIPLWLRDLKPVVNDLNDLVEELSSNNASFSSSSSSLKEKKFSVLPNPIKSRHKAIISKIKKVTEDLQAVATEPPKATPSEEASKKEIIKLDTKIEEEEETVGREKEKKEIIDQLIFPLTKTEGSYVVVNVVTIVGVADVGKTTLARLICGDERVESHFGSKIWIDGTADVESIAKRVTESPPTTGGKGYLVVVDDLSTEIGDECLSKLQQIINAVTTGLPCVASILITTRSKLVANKITASLRSNNVAAAVATVKPHVLQGLNEKDSLSLFRKIRSTDINEEMERKIVMDCGGVPPWIIIAARLLNNRGSVSPLATEADCTAFKEEFIRKLKFKYYDKFSRLQKLCFAHCSLFPQDHFIIADKLVRLWVAEGFLLLNSTTKKGGESVEDIFRDFLIGKPIFKDVEEDECGVVKRLRIQPLMHDLASFVADHEENVTIDPDGEKVHKGILRASFDFSLDVWRGIPVSLFEKAEKLRAILLWKAHTLPTKEMKMSVSTCEKIVKSFSKTLRMLDLHDLGMKTLPSSIGELKNVRYLDLSLNNMEKLPGSITKLTNLQTLKLSQCYLLKELPKNIEDLISLKHLETEGCLALIHMPRKINKLSSTLQTLSLFVVSKDYHLGGLGELASLNNLKGHLEILHLERNSNLSKQDKCLERKEHLQCLTLRWDHEEDEEDEGEENGNGPRHTPHFIRIGCVMGSRASTHHYPEDEKLMESLEPHTNLRGLLIVGYKGVKLSNWLSSMKCLVKLSLYECTSCKFLPPKLDQLPNLRILEILRLDNLEFIAESGTNDNDKDKPALFFPSLEELTISDCPKLTGWRKEDKNGTNLPIFPCISKLHLSYCPKLICMPLFPGLDEELVLVGSSIKPLQAIRVHGKTRGITFSKLKSMQIATIEEPSPPQEWLQYLSSLEKLHIREWKQLASLPSGFQHLSSLQSLTIENCPELDLELSRNEWEGLKNLRSLVIKENPKLKSLPTGVDKVTSLQDLVLHNCPELASLPETMSNLKSLGRLVLSECNKLASLPKGLKLNESLDTLIVLDCALLMPRCQPNTGDDWPQISHIKNKLVRENSRDI